MAKIGNIYIYIIYHILYNIYNIIHLPMFHFARVYQSVGFPTSGPKRVHNKSTAMDELFLLVWWSSYNVPHDFMCSAEPHEP